MADIKATSAITIVDMSDGKQLSVYISSNQARIQIKDVNTNTWMPDWSVGVGNVILTPSVYVNQSAVALTGAGAVVTWERRAGSGSVGVLEANETVSNGVLTVNANKLSTAVGGLLTYIVTVTYTDPDTALVSVAKNEISFALVTTGENAKSAWISGEQVFKYAAGASTPAPASITLTANLQNVSMSKWQYKNGGSWSDFAPAQTGTTIAIAPDSPAFLGGAVATIRAVTSDANIGDTTSVYKVTDGTAGGAGAAGQNASVAFLTNENITFAGNVSGQVAAITVICNVVAYTGTTKVTPTVGTVTGAVTGMTVTKLAETSNEIPIQIAIAANATLGGAGAQQGTLTVPITTPVATTLYITWSKVNTGATGADAIVFSVFAPNGSVFVNQQGNLTLDCVMYKGATAVTPSYSWRQYAGGNWNTVVSTTKTATIAGSTVSGTGQFKCIATYNSVAYEDFITLEDKTDNYQSIIDSTAGNVFKNTVGNTVLTCRVFQNGVEVDAAKSTSWGPSTSERPATPATGAFYYQYANTAPTTASRPTTVWRWSGSAWVDVTADVTYKHTLTYKWYRRNASGVPESGDGGGTGLFATGKLIYVDGSMVTDKAVITCEVE